MDSARETILAIEKRTGIRQVELRRKFNREVARVFPRKKRVIDSIRESMGYGERKTHDEDKKVVEVAGAIAGGEGVTAPEASPDEVTIAGGESVTVPEATDAADATVDDVKITGGEDIIEVAEAASDEVAIAGGEDVAEVTEASSDEVAIAGGEDVAAPEAEAAETAAKKIQKFLRSNMRNFAGTTRRDTMPPHLKHVILVREALEQRISEMTDLVTELKETESSFRHDSV